VSNLAGTIVPNIVAKAAQATDDKVREVKPTKGGLSALPERIANTIESRVPGLSERLPEKKSGMGGDVERPGNAASRFLSPIQVSEDKDNAALTQKLIALDAVPSPPKKAIKVKGKDVQLTDAEFEQINKADEKASAELQRMMESGSFTRLPEERQRQIAESAYNRARNAARTKIIASSDFRRRAREASR
jgi:hypothetical protein